MQFSRRDFLRTAAGTAAVLAFPNLRAASTSPLARVNMAFVGVGNQAGRDLQMFALQKDLVNVVALCDTQMGAPHTLAALRQFPSVPRYTDFRKMLAEHGKEIDAVCIGTPDFSHFPAAMLAMAMGKAVYCEKPMSNCSREIALMTAAARRHKVVTQMGNQGHSDANIWQMRALVANGFIKDVTRIDAFFCANNRRWYKWKGTLQEMPGAEPVPREMNWDVWQAQRPARAYNHNYINGDWRCFYEYGTGALGDWGAHLFDAAHECLGLGLPTRVTLKTCDRATPAVYPMAATIEYAFPNCTLVWREGVGNLPARPAKVTDAAWKLRDVGELLHLADGRVFSRGSHGDALRLIAGADPKDPAIKKTLRAYQRGTSGHYLNFLKAVKGEEKANSDFAVAGPLSQVLALGAVAQRLAHPVSLAFDAAKGAFTGTGSEVAAANAFLAGPPARKGWEQYAQL